MFLFLIPSLVSSIEPAEKILHTTIMQQLEEEQIVNADVNARTILPTLQNVNAIQVGVASSQPLQNVHVQKEHMQENIVEQTYDLGSVALTSVYTILPSGLFQERGKERVKQTFIVDNKVEVEQELVVQVKHELPFSTVMWDNEEYEITEEKTYFRAYYVPIMIYGEEPMMTLTGHTVYFGDQYYDFRDIVELDYEMFVYQENGKNYLVMSVHTTLNDLETFIIDPEIGWVSRTITTTADNAVSVHVNDIDSDGDLDVLSASSLDDTIAWYEHNGASLPNWTKRVINNTLDGVHNVFSIDVDGDNDLDVVGAVQNSNSVAWFENDGNTPPNWTSRTIIATLDEPQFVRAATIDSGSTMDIVSIGIGNHTIAWHENNGATPPGWTTRQISTTPRGPRGVYLVDLEQDGDTDIIAGFSSPDDQVGWFENDGSNPPIWTLNDINTTVLGAHEVFAADLNNDSTLDVISANIKDDTVTWYENTSNGWKGRIIQDNVDGAVTVYAADLDNDNDIDVVSGNINDDTVMWYENDGGNPPFWTNHTITSTADGVRSVFVADVDNDSDLDILSASLNDDTIAWYESKLHFLQINDMIPLQVVENVDHVKGKKTLVHINFTANSNSNVSAEVSLNGSIITTGETTADANGEGVLNIFYTNNSIVGDNIEVQVNVTNEEYDIIRVEKELINITETRDLNIVFLPFKNEKAGVGNNPEFFETSAEVYTEFVDVTFPFSHDGLGVFADYAPISANPFVNESGQMNNNNVSLFLDFLFISGVLGSGNANVDRVIGIGEAGTFVGDDRVKGFTMFGKKAVIANFDPVNGEGRHYVAHELGHTFGLCDEYNRSAWTSANNDALLINEFGGCPNGNNGVPVGQLDDSCLDSSPSLGCDTQIFSELVPWNDTNGSLNLYNMMGDANGPNSRWVTNESYQHLIDTNFSFCNDTGEATPTGEIIIVRGTSEGGVTELLNSYTFASTSNIASIICENSANFTVSLKNDSEIFSQVQFNIPFRINNIGGDVESVNRSSFVVAIPYNENITTVIVEENNITKDSMNKSLNTPSIELLANLNGRAFSKEINLSWNATDNDNDTLMFALLISQNGGENFVALDIDIEETNISINSSLFEEGDLYVLKTFVTDGINTNGTQTGNFTIDHDLALHNLNLLHTNGTTSIFEFIITNNLNRTLNIINWTLNTGENTTVNSTLQFNLSSGEDIFNYVEYDYSANGNYTIITTAFAENFTDSQTINITI